MGREHLVWKNDGDVFSSKKERRISISEQIQGKGEQRDEENKTCPSAELRSRQSRKREDIRQKKENY